jgi:transposase
MQAYSKEFRRAVLAACDAGGRTRAVAQRFHVSEAWVRRIKQERREQRKAAPCLKDETLCFIPRQDNDANQWESVGDVGRC